ncbi:MAG: right-handed parallel beta-helix repeat-containing protein [Pirellulaceae bacterium]|nr:right-handed parallel beta-helix repeat-containing protein [Pirellulaceae bacterium]
MHERGNRSSRGRHGNRLVRSSTRRSLAVEKLEERALRAILTVNSISDNVNADDGVMTLREAIIASNSTVGHDTIVFSIGQGGPAVIRPLSPLPAISDSAVIDGRQFGFVRPVIEIDGSLLPIGQATFWVTGNVVEISYLSIHSARGVGVFLTGSHNRVTGNYIGLDASGVVDRGNLYQGVYVSSTSNFIAGNVISGNDANGIWIDGTSAALNSISNNFIGTDWSGAFSIANGLNGVLVTAGDGNSIANNIIAGNGNTGVWIIDSVGNSVASNWVGTNALGSSAIGNASTGIRLSDSASGNRITGNIISNNRGYGLEMYNGAISNQIGANVIGLTPDGASVLGNSLAGIYDGAGYNVIGGDDRSFLNLISGNRGSGIWLNASNSVIANNYVGTNITGEIARGNAESGILVTGSNNSIRANVTSGNGFHGVAIVNATSTSNTVSSNLIGTNAGGNVAIQNAFQSVFLSGNSNTLADNVISGSGGNGIRIDGGSSNRIERNKIGTNLLGTAALANAVNGILVWLGASNNIIQDNTISANGNTGIWMLGADVIDNRVQGNRIGVTLNGSAALGNATSGVRIGAGANRNTVQANVISGNRGEGVELYGFGTSSNVLYGNIVGLNSLGNAAIPNLQNGILVSSGATNNTIGQLGAGQRNFISGNARDGVRLSGADSGGNKVTGNFIGTDGTGLADLGNRAHGLNIDSDFNELVENIIAGNDGSGIVFNSADNNVVLSNMIGLGVDGSTALGHPGVGIYVVGSGNRIGGRLGGSVNVISNSVFSGIEIYGAGSTKNLVQGNFIGTDRSGTASRGNGSPTYVNTTGGILVTNGATDNVIGTDFDGVSDREEGNLISGNLTQGIHLLNAPGNRIAGNRIGINLEGTSALPNAGSGIRINRSNANTIGGSTMEARNTVSGNTLAGILVESSNNNEIAGNYVGTNLSGNAAVPNVTNGIQLQAGSANNKLGGPTAVPGTGLGNLISGNSQRGISMLFAGSNNTVQGNIVGLNASGNARLRNNFQGIEINNTSQAVIGGSSPNLRNVISANTGSLGGILIAGGSSNTVQGNYVGTDLTGNLALGNSTDGIYIVGASSNLIGGDLPAAGNLIAGNQRDGVWIQDAIAFFGLNREARDNVLKNNRIGEAANGLPLGNLRNGVTISDGADGSFIESNIIANNQGSGVALFGATTIQNRIRGNSIYQNRLLGIDLEGDGVSANDLGDLDTGANTRLNFPILHRVVTGENTQVAGRFQGGASITVTLEFFANSDIDESGFGEGRRSLGTAVVTTDASGLANFDVRLSAATSNLEFISATAMDAIGNTSEFSRPLGLDLTPPISRVNALPVQATSLSIPISISGSDPELNGRPASGVESYAVYVAEDNQTPRLWRTISAASPNAEFPAQSDRTYSFFALARDWAGNVESKLAVAEAVIYVPDLSPPTTNVSFVDSTNPTFRIDVVGSDVGSSGMNSFAIYVQVDGGTPTQIGILPAGLPSQDSLHRGSVAFQAIADGQSHSYRFYSIGSDRRGNVEAPPSSPSSDIVLTAMFAPPIDLSISSFDVQRGAKQRSYIRYLDIGVNSAQGINALIATVNDTDPNNDRVRLRRFAVDGTGIGVPIPLNGALNFSAVDKIMQIDFGSGGLGGDPGSASANGYYALEFDLDGNDTFESVRNFYRLLGDTNSDRVVNSVDYMAVVQRSRVLGSGFNLDEDLNSDNVVNSTDIAYARTGLLSPLRSIAPTLRLDD